jgi:subtilisin-like proprotein convertase family protein
MPQVKFGRKDEPTSDLERSDDLIAVRTRSRKSLRAGPVLSAAAAEVQDALLLAAFPEAGVEVYKTPPGRKPLDDRKRALRAFPDVRFAGGVLVDPISKEPVVYTENLFIKFIDDLDAADCERIIRDAGLQIKSKQDFATNAYFLAAPEGIGVKVFDIALALLERDDVEYCHPEVVRMRGRRLIFAQQWHLKTTAIDGINIAASANVEAAHQVTRGEGTTIAIIDDGVDIDHPEFAASGKITSPRDATLGTDDPRPKDPDPRFPENHGTACAGVAGAEGSQGASGVAPKARLMPIRLSSALGSMQEAQAFKWAADHGADVISCSWGPEDGVWWDPNDPRHAQSVPLPASTRLAIDFAVTNGRAGKGCVVLFAAGNGNESVENDGYASYPNVIAVVACNDRGRRSVYSDFGAAVFCAFPSSDQEWPEQNHPASLTPGIWTTDRRGTRGYNQGLPNAMGDDAGNYTNDFGGTSSACPGAAGVAALILSVNPGLKAREARDILARACDRIDPQNGQYDGTGRSPLYGFGRLNAATAVQLAQPSDGQRLSIVRRFDRALPDLQTVRVELEITEASMIDALSVHVDLLHTYVGDLVITLFAPPEMAQAPIVLQERKGGNTRDLLRDFDATLVPDLALFHGKSARGIWTLEIQDRAERDDGTLRTFGLDLKLANPDAADRSQPQPRLKNAGPTRTRKSTRTAASVRRRP